ncbi:ABC transporter ATP-binding protein [Porphyromonas sp. oral taxon 275]|uniref:ABC transporter ATP-binding protein n=1 Tax=Porphyromonas sp. oral taxon 275 TaxID=712435 RepID=UPI001BA87069|nr:ATP-binding cassette domain-containing protein [Porphyromonas sp. oral taxon 275]QUB43684.1 ATP-binding cassette domain-containing protein [Porphyromonas sp. oral taxon 275]
MTAPSLLEIDMVSKHYDTKVALDQVSLSARQGRILGLLGPNGAGKSSLIRIINRITAPDRGEVFFDGHLLQQQDLSRIGYLPEERGLYPKMKVGEQIVYLARLKGMSRSQAERGARELLARLEGADWWDKRVNELSKGMQQKVQVVCTLLHDPELLIMDEPFSGFDPINAELLKQELLRLKAEGKTIILSTHNMQSVEELCDDIVLINQGQIVLRGQTEEVRRSYSTGRVRLAYDGVLPPSVTSDVRILERQASSMGGLLWLDAEGLSLRELVSSLPAELELCSLERELPSMHEIFLSAVSQSLSHPLAHE